MLNCGVQAMSITPICSCSLALSLPCFWESNSPNGLHKCPDRIIRDVAALPHA